MSQDARKPPDCACTAVIASERRIGTRRVRRDILRDVEGGVEGG